MREVGAFEAKNTLSALLDEVEKGEEVTITRHGKPVARLIPSQPVVDREAARSAMARVRARAKALGLNLSLDEIKAFRDEGRQ